MAGATDIEKKSLEAHVELCAERYSNLDSRLMLLDDKIDGVGVMVEKVHIMIGELIEKRNNQIISWGIGIIGCLVSVIGYLVVHYVAK